MGLQSRCLMEKSASRRPCTAAPRTAAGHLRLPNRPLSSYDLQHHAGDEIRSSVSSQVAVVLRQVVPNRATGSQRATVSPRDYITALVNKDSASEGGPKQLSGPRVLL